MLLQFKVKNFKSIGEEIVLDMTAAKCSEHKNFLIEKNGIDILPVASIYGSNASGKSNVVNALLAMLMRVHLIVPQRVPIVPFLYKKELRDLPTNFEIFVADGTQELKYGFAINSNDEILEEWLYERKLSKKELVWKGVFERNEKSGITFDTVKYKNLQAYKHIFDTDKRLLALTYFGSRPAIAGAETVLTRLYRWFSFGWDHGGNAAFNKEIKDSALLYYLNKSRLDSFDAFIKEFDPCVKKVEIIPEEVNGREEYKVYMVHGEENKRYTIDMQSDGTKKLFSCFLAFHIFFNEERGVFVADELDSHLHPLILRRIVNMFHDKNINKMGSQLIFTSHNLVVLDNRELRRDEIWFTEKNEDGFTKLYSLAEFKTNDESVRNDLSFGKHYLAGRFGAIPYK